MSMIYVGIASVAVGAGTSLYSSRQSSKASKSALAQQTNQANQAFAAQQNWMDYFKEAIAAFSEQAFALAGESKDEVRGSSARARNYINAIPEVTELIDQGQELSRKDFDFRTGIKRENLDFIVGDNMETLRDAQTSNTNIANLNSADFQGKFSDIVRSSMFGLKANTIGDPYGTFSNLSARNLYDFSQQGLSNALALNDFFSREGTVDPVSPLATAFDLRTVAEREASMQVQNEQWRANSIAQVNSGLMGALGGALGAQGNVAQMGIGLESNNLANLSTLSNAGLVAQQSQMQGYVNAAGQITSGLMQAYGLSTQRAAVNNANQFNNAMIAQYSNNANTARYSAGSGNPASMRPSGI
jgi:hypothetical protein